MTQTSGDNRVFLFLQGPHGPFFQGLAKMLSKSGAQVFRVGFNAGDAFFWHDKRSFLKFDQPQDTWRDYINTVFDEKCITDLALYGDTREIHAVAVEEARKRGIEVHIFEEGYIRPFWVTYERGGSNGNSRLMQLTIPDMQKALEGSDLEAPLPPARWGDMRQHVFYGALYHWFVMFMNGKFSHFKPHRDLSVTQEFQLYLKRFFLMPFHAIERRVATYRIRHGGFPYHLALLQLEHDSSFQMHSPFNSMTEFLDLVMENFAEGAPKHHHLVFKAHPLEDGRVSVRKEILELSKKYGISDRVHFVRGGKLAQLLNEARTAVTVNSTAGQQVLWRGIPLKIFGKSVYDQPEFICGQSLRNFFAGALRPDMTAYREYRRFLLETSQVAGGFYSRKGRRQLMRHVVDMMLSKEDPYDALALGTAAPRQQLRSVK